MKSFRHALALSVALLPGLAFGQTSPNWALHYVPLPAEWNALWASKADYANLTAEVTRAEAAEATAVQQSAVGTTVAPLPLTQFQGVKGVSPLQLPHWRAAIANAETQTASSNVVFIGDSTFIGINASNVAFSQNLTALFAEFLNNPAKGLYVNQNGFCGMSTGSGSGNRLTNDPQGRVTKGSWGALAPNGYRTLGGAILYDAASGLPFVFTPGTLVDTFNIISSQYQAASSATFTATPTGGTAATINDYGTTAALTTTTVTSPTPATSNAVTLNYTGGGGSQGQVNVFCMNATLSTQKSINIFNAGWWGATSTGIASLSAAAQPYNPIPTLEYLAPALTVIEVDINDWQQGVSVATHNTNLQALISAAQLSGDVVLMTGEPNANGSAGAMAAITAATIALGQADNIPVLDWNGRMVSVTNATNLGLMSDTIHQNSAGYADEAQMLENAIGRP